MMDKSSPRTTTSPSIIIPRPKSVFSKKDTARLDDSYQLWMQEYHRQHHHHRNQQLMKAAQQQSGTTANTFSKGSTVHPRSPKKSRGPNLFLKFNSLKFGYNNDSNGFKKSQSFSSGDVKHDQHTDTLDGYRIYKGPGNLTLGISRQSPTFANGNSDGEQKALDNNGTILAPYTPLILPDKFILAPSKSLGHDKSGAKLNNHQNISPQQTLKQTTTPFHIQLHPQRRPRPHSASLDFSTYHSSTVKEKNGAKTKENTKNTKTLLQSSYKAPTVTTIQLHSSEAIALTPRSIPHLSNNKTIDINTEPKSEQNIQPKSILKNQKDSITTPSHSIHLGIPNYSKTLPLSHQKVKHEFAYHELILSPGKTRHLSPNRRSSAHRTSSSASEARRPQSASAATVGSKYELHEHSPPCRRKSVSFNSYVSFLSDSRVSTIRSLPVDV